MDRDGLRKAGLGQNAWTKDELLAGLKYFFELNGRYPTAHEIDAFEFLPSSRSIQRSYGGLVNLRQELIPDGEIDHTKGDYRSNQAKQSDARAKAQEEEFYTFLTLSLKPISVHEHKIVRPGGVACDFFIYLSDDSAVVIDLFYAASILNLLNIVNIKLKRYAVLDKRLKVFFVMVGNDAIEQEEIDIRMAQRRQPLPMNISVCTEEFFKTHEFKGIVASSYYKN